MAKLFLSLLSLFAALAAADPTTCQAPTAMGCFVDPYKTPDGTMRRVLNMSVASDDKALTRESCIAACCKAGFDVGALAGLEAGKDCFCDKGFGPYIVPQDNSVTILTPVIGRATCLSPPEHTVICMGGRQ